MSAKDNDHHDDHECNTKKTLHRRLFAIFLGLIALILFLILLIFLILRPTKPHFILQDATIYAFNTTAPNSVTTNLQITLTSRNPNARIGIYYDKLDVYAAYHGQQITLATLLPPSYQGHKDITVWSPFLYGNGVPVAPYVAVSMNQDEIAGTVLVDVKVDGKIRWKVGSFVSGKYHLHANCPVYINLGLAAVKYQLVSGCHVDV